MSDKSPLFVSALELIAHATELFAQKNPKKYKFIVLHLANAVELILKDCVIDHGLSIYEKPGITINIWESIKKLQSKEVDIPELPVIELIIDDRNTIQHRFGHPSAESTYFYIEQVVSFFQRFLHHHYNINLTEALISHLPDEHLKLLGLAKDEFSFLDQLASISIESSVLRAANSTTRELTKLLRSSIPDDLYHYTSLLSGSRQRARKALLEDLRRNGFVHRDLVKDYDFLQEARNFAAHNPEEAPDIDWQEAFNIAKELLTGLREANKSGYTFKLDEEILKDLQKYKEERNRSEEDMKKMLERRKLRREMAAKAEYEESQVETMFMVMQEDFSRSNAPEPESADSK
jgi:hypothetical protein